MNHRVLVYAGAHLGGSLSTHLRDFDRVIAFEANPWFCEHLIETYGHHENLTVVNGALCEIHGTPVSFYISKNGGDSSSLLKPNKDNALFSAIQPSQQVVADGINLCTFLKEQGIDAIDTYISDLQGYDYVVLKTMKPFIDRGAIRVIECEVSKSNRTPIYEYGSIEANTDENFESLLSDRYERIATGWGRLTDGIFSDVPENWSEWDVRWRLKTT
jgi:FkbM family methyltransferase